jgi:hypothetical protein
MRHHFARAEFSMAKKGTPSDIWKHDLPWIGLFSKHFFPSPFPEWCQRISGFLQGGQSFKAESTKLDEYALLPAFWHGMEPVKKKTIVGIVDKHRSWNVECVKELYQVGHVVLKDMQNLRVCVEMAKQHPEHLDYVGSLSPCVDATMGQEEEAAVAVLADVTDGLVSFQLQPKRPAVAGEEPKSHFDNPLDHFEHMCQLLRRSSHFNRTMPLRPSATAGVLWASEEQQRQTLEPTPADYTMAEIAVTAHGEGA